eukprot:scaffold3267_cov140-Cylindrotheca_fusiformis.AAC.13
MEFRDIPYYPSCWHGLKKEHKKVPDRQQENQATTSRQLARNFPPHQLLLYSMLTTRTTSCTEPHRDDVEQSKKSKTRGNMLIPKIYGQEPTNSRVIP